MRTLTKKDLKDCLSILLVIYFIFAWCYHIWLVGTGAEITGALVIGWSVPPLAMFTFPFVI